MRTANKLVLGSTIGMMIVLSAHAVITSRRWTAVIETDERQDGQRLANAISLAIGLEWDQRGREGALSLLSRLARRESEVQLAWVPSATMAISPGDEGANTAPSIPTSSQHESRNELRSYAWVKDVTPAGIARGAIQVTQVLSRAPIRDSIKRLGVAALLVLLLNAVLAAVLSRRWVERPTARLLAMAKEVGAGKFEARASIENIAGGEFLAIGDALNGMAVRLQASQEATNQERQQRLDAEAQLRWSQKLEAIGTLASGVAHDFNNLLMGVNGCTSIAISKLDADDPALPYLREVKTATENGVAITRQLLAFSRESKTEFQVFDLNTLVTGGQTLMGGLLGDHIEVVVRTGAQNSRVLANRGLIEQVLMNLAVNARDAMPTGGQLLIETRDLKLAESNEYSLAAGEYVVMAVSDTGIGIPDEVKEHVFEPFFTTKEIGKGTGLGLSIVYGIVKEAGGQVHVRSEANRGTTFEIVLPVTQQMPASEAKTVVEDAEQAAGTILVVEDVHSVRMTARFYLEGAGYQVLDAESGAEAVALCKQCKGRIDLVLADVMLPGMSGPETLQEIRKFMPNIKVIYMSAHAKDYLVEQERIGPDVRALQKPFSSDHLLGSVREALGRTNAPGS